MYGRKSGSLRCLYLIPHFGSQIVEPLAFSDPQATVLVQLTNHMSSFCPLVDFSEDAEKRL
jgi:hypothetical protein